MKLYSAVILLAIANNACAQSPPSQPPRPPGPALVAGSIDSAELARFIDQLITEQIAKENIPGAVFLLVQNGKVLYQGGYGFANVARRQPVNPETTIWRIGSISKVFTATAVVQLADRGRYRLSDDVNWYLKRFKVPATFPQPVTFEHLLTHTAGFDEIRPGTRAETLCNRSPCL